MLGNFHPVSASTVKDTFLVETVNYMEPFLITDLRTGDAYQHAESFNIHNLSIYSPQPAQTGRPVIFFVHGGAWVDGYASWYDFVPEVFTGQKGWVTVVMDYRLTSEDVFLADEHCPARDACPPLQRTKAAWYPDPLTDVGAALGWVIAHIQEYGGDPEKIFVFGHSAGGHLASLVALHPDTAALRPSIRGLISMSGVYDLTNDLTRLTFQSEIQQTFPGGVNDLNALWEASPAAYVQPGTVYPDSLILYAQLDLPSFLDQSIQFEEQLRLAGADTTLIQLPGYNHTTEMEAISNPEAAPTRAIIQFVEEKSGMRAYLPVLGR